MSTANELIDHLFRTESGKMIVVLTKLYGLQRLEDAENAVQETFLTAFQTWSLKGVPDNPPAWLYRVAKNKIINVLKRADAFGRILERNRSVFPIEFILDAKFEESVGSIEDSQLEMLYATCHPAIAPDGRVALALKTLCGFSVQEIARGFLRSPDVIEKRLYRARKIARSHADFLALPAAERLAERTASVLAAIYLLFNEGYHSTSNETILRKDLCLEALRLALLIANHPVTAHPDADALIALFAFHASRFDARLGPGGDIVRMAEQDRSLWNRELIDRGEFHLHRAMRATAPGRYHVEARIAALHLRDDGPAKWNELLACYDALLVLAPGPIVELNRVYALSRVYSATLAIEAARSIRGLETHPFYHALLAHLLQSISRAESASHWEAAARLTNVAEERKIYESRAAAVRFPESSLL